MSMDRRTFLARVAAAGGAVLASPLLSNWELVAQPPISRVAFVKTSDRTAGVSRAIDLLQLPRFHQKDIFIKPNFNSADTPPGSTHMDMLAALVRKLRGLGAGPLTLGDRSGMGNTREVMDAKGAFKLAQELDVKAIIFDDLNPDDWHRAQGAHWQRGFALPQPVLNAGAIVQTCCLKTHRYGGHFTLSLKNSVGLAAKFVPDDPYNFMHELHSSPNQRRMIAEINAAYKPELVVLDGVEAFVTGGPDTGRNVAAQVILAGTDRVAIDAVGVALLRYYGTTPEVSRGSIFEQEQIARAVELKLGAGSAEQIELVTGDRESAEYAKNIRAVLDGAAVHA
jgi:uncharacterized protein (DUF362 family)